MDSDVKHWLGRVEHIIIVLKRLGEGDITRHLDSKGESRSHGRQEDTASA